MILENNGELQFANHFQGTEIHRLASYKITNIQAIPQTSGKTCLFSLLSGASIATDQLLLNDCALSIIPHTKSHFCPSYSSKIEFQSNSIPVPAASYGQPGRIAPRNLRPSNALDNDLLIARHASRPKRSIPPRCGARFYPICPSLTEHCLCPMYSHRRSQGPELHHGKMQLRVCSCTYD